MHFELWFGDLDCDHKESDNNKGRLEKLISLVRLWLLGF